MEKRELNQKASLVIDSLVHLRQPDERMTDENKKQGRTGGIISRDFGIDEWDWPQGVGLYGLKRWKEVTQDHTFDPFLKEWFEKNFNRGLPSENINTTAPFLTLMDVLDYWDSSQYEIACLERADWLMKRLPRTENGLFQHVTSAIGDRSGVRLNDNEVWIDTIFMAVLFLNKMGQRYECKEWIEESRIQIEKHIQYLWNQENGLFYHGYSFKRKDHFGGIFWCRGNSWFTNGIMDYIECCGERIPQVLRRKLITVYLGQVETLKKLQAPSGLWHTVLDDAESYEEVSGSAAILAGILKGVRMGILDIQDYGSCIHRGIEAVCGWIGDDGIVGQVSGGTGVGMNADAYKNIIIAPMAYGQALALIALVEAMRQWEVGG